MPKHSSFVFVYVAYTKDELIFHIVSPGEFLSREKYIHAFSELHFTFSFYLIKHEHGNIPFPFKFIIFREVKRAPSP